MNKVKNFENSIVKTLFAKVLENTLFTILLTAVLSSGVILYFKDIVEFFLSYWGISLLITIIVLIAYFYCRYETVIKRIKISDENLKNEWKNNEFRSHIPSIAEVRDKSIFLQFMEIPFTLNEDLPDSYALEFRTKVLNFCFSWCLNVNIADEDMTCYMFQYDPSTKRLRPHFLVGYEKLKLITLWLTPDSTGSPIKSVDNLVLKVKNDWYHIRTEVSKFTVDNKIPDLDDLAIKPLIPTYKDNNGKIITFDKKEKNVAIEIKIYDLYNLGKLVYHTIFNEPPFKCFEGKKIGFRNWNFESALYKDIVIKAL